MTTATGNRDSAGRVSGRRRARGADGTTGCCKPEGRTVSDQKARTGNQASAAGNGGPDVLNRTSRRTAHGGVRVGGISSFPRASWQPAGWMNFPASGPQVQHARSGRQVATVECESRGRDDGPPAHATIDPGPDRTAVLATARCLCPFGSAGVVTPNVWIPQVATGSGRITARPAGRQTMTGPDQASAFDVTDSRRKASVRFRTVRHSRRTAALPAHLGTPDGRSGTSASRNGVPCNADPRESVARQRVGLPGGNVQPLRQAPGQPAPLSQTGRGPAATAADGEPACVSTVVPSEGGCARTRPVRLTRRRHPAVRPGPRRLVWRDQAGRVRRPAVGARSRPGPAWAVGHGFGPARAGHGKHPGVRDGLGAHRVRATSTRPLSGGRGCVVRSDTGPWSDSRARTSPNILAGWTHPN